MKKAWKRDELPKKGGGGGLDILQIYRELSKKEGSVVFERGEGFDTPMHTDIINLIFSLSRIWFTLTVHGGWNKGRKLEISRKVCWPSAKYQKLPA